MAIENQKEKENSDKAQYDLIITGGKTRYLPHRERVSDSKTKAAWQYLEFLGQIGFSIALPIAGGAFLGHYLDQLWSSFPKATLGLLFLGVIISLVGFVRTVMIVIKDRSKPK